MPDFDKYGDRRPNPDIDISSPGFGGRNWLWVVVLLLLTTALYLTFGMTDDPDQPNRADLFWRLQALAVVCGLAILVAFVAWIAIVKRGIFTWMRLAVRPAKLMALGDAAGAEVACVKALERARRFAPNDHRRGMMLCELAMYVKNQGRQSESLALYEESVGILAQYQATYPMDYFVVLNNYAICFISLKDYGAAQRSLEKVIDLTLTASKRQAGKALQMTLKQLQMLQFVLHLNLAFLFMEMQELHEAELQLREADALTALLSKRTLANWHNHYVALCALWEFESGNFIEAENEIAEATDPDYLVCLRVRSKLHLVRQEFAQAEQLLRKHQDEARKAGTLHRPDLLNATLEFAESLFGQAKHDDAFAALQESRAIVADFALPADAAWRKSLETWLQRARELGKADVAASLDAELGAMPAAVEQRITILEKFRVQPPDAK